MVNKNVAAMNVSGVRKMFEMASKMKNPIDLSIGMPDFEVPEEIKEEAVKSIKSGLNKYSSTTGIKPLKEKIADKLLKENGIDAKEDEIIVTSSVSGAISIILTAIINQGDEVIVFDPYFVSYKELIVQNGGIPVFAKTNQDFSPNFKEIESKITGKTIAIMINSPNNPTGKIYTEEELRKIAEIAEKHKLLVISDEIYEKFCYEKKHFSIGSIYKNTVTMNGFAKAYAMAGWRVGYCHGPKEIIDSAIKVQQFNFVCAPTPFQYAAIKAFDVDVEKYIEEYRLKRDIIYEGLKKKYKLNKPEGAFYAFIKYPYEKSKFIQDCIDNELLVVPGNVFSLEDTHFRISFANKNEVLKKAVKILNELA